MRITPFTQPPDLDAELAREVFLEAATLLDDGLALDGLDEHDARVVVAGLCVDLVAPDPGAAVRARSQAALDLMGREGRDPSEIAAEAVLAVVTAGSGA